MIQRLLFGGLLAAALAIAQPGGMSGAGSGMGADSVGGGSGRGSASGGGDMGGGMPRAMPTPMERMTTLLQLTKDQKKQVKTVMDDAQKEAMPVRDQMVKNRGTIAQAVAAGKSQDEINASINEYAAAQAKMTQIEIHAFAKIYTALEKDQQAKAPGILGMMNGIFKGKNWDSNPTSN